MLYLGDVLSKWHTYIYIYMMMIYVYTMHISYMQIQQICTVYIYIYIFVFINTDACNMDAFPLLREDGKYHQVSLDT